MRYFRQSSLFETCSRWKCARFQQRSATSVVLVLKTPTKGHGPIKDNNVEVRGKILNLKQLANNTDTSDQIGDLNPGPHR